MTNAGRNLITSLSRIREIIASSLADEAQSGELRAHYHANLPVLRTRLLLPENEPVSALIAFVTSYIRSVPAGLRLVTAVSKRQGFYEYAEPFLQVAQDYFLRPPTGIANHGPLEALLDEAFLTHRLLEEVNDHHLKQLSRPLLPLDMTEANTIVHHLLGDNVGSRLEGIVQDTAGQLLSKEHVWEQARHSTRVGTTALLSTDRLYSRQEREVRLRLAS